MTSNSHIAVEELSAFLDDELPDIERLNVERHLAGCTSCQEELAAQRALVSLLHSLPQVEPPRSFTLSEEQVGYTRPAVRPILRFMPAVRTLSVAAVVAFLVVSSVVVFNQTTGDDVSDNSAPTTETEGNTGASEDVTGDSDVSPGGLIDRGDSAASNSVPPSSSSAEAPAAAGDQDDLAQSNASPDVTDSEPEEAPAAVTDADDSDDDGSPWLMTSLGLGALALVLVGLWLLLVRMGRSQRRLA